MFNVQRIDGFLAVLNITGGNFSPKTQKLPFTVTSMDGNNYLLYYASIDLAGNVQANKYSDQTMRRSLSIDDSRSERSRLRIPMKGRIQLVTYPSFLQVCMFIEFELQLYSFYKEQCFFIYVYHE